MVGKDRCEIIDENKIKRDRNRNIILGMGIAFVVCFVGFMIFIYPFLLKNIQYETQETINPLTKIIMVINSSLGLEKARIIADEAGLCAKISGESDSLILALWKIESNLDPGAISPKGAIGIGQLMTVWPDATFKLRDGCRASCRKLIHFSTIEKGNLLKTLERYNSGAARKGTRYEFSKRVIQESERIENLK